MKIENRFLFNSFRVNNNILQLSIWRGFAFLYVIKIITLINLLIFSYQTIEHLLELQRLSEMFYVRVL